MSNLLPAYNTKLFTDIYEDATTFGTDYAEIALGGITDSTLITKLYYLLYARYGNSPIANLDETQFKYKLFSVIFMYGPTWEKRLDVQEALRNLSLDDLILGSKAIYNHAFNPSTEPSTATLEELTYINDQNTTNYKRSKMDAYSQLWELLSTDVTSQFLDKFQVCFKQFVMPTRILIFETDVDEDDE